MLTSIFERLFRNLVGAFVRYEDVPRTLDAVTELGAARWDLEVARNAIAVERGRLTAQAARRVVLRKTATSDDDLARLRVSLDGFSR